MSQNDDRIELDLDGCGNSNYARGKKNKVLFKIFHVIFHINISISITCYMGIWQTHKQHNNRSLRVQKVQTILTCSQNVLKNQITSNGCPNIFA